MKILSDQPDPQCPAPQPCLRQRAARKPRAVPTTGTAVTAFTVAASRRVYNQDTDAWQDGDTLFLRCSAWRDLADHAAESLTKGMRVIVTGRLKQRSYETPEGDKRTVYEVDVEDLGPSLKWATAKIAKTSRDKVPHPADGPDPWEADATVAAGADRPPF
jgi:single-strand DNA-binding protein